MTTSDDSGSLAFLESSEVLQSLLADADFQAQLEADSHAALSAKGLHLPPDLEIRVHRNSEDVFHLVLPPDPNVSLSDESLSAIAGGACACNLSPPVNSYNSFGCMLGCIASTVSTSFFAPTPGGE